MDALVVLPQSIKDVGDLSSEHQAEMAPQDAVVDTSKHTISR